MRRAVEVVHSSASISSTRASTSARESVGAVDVLDGLLLEPVQGLLEHALGLLGLGLHVLQHGRRVGGSPRGHAWR
ncbi:hypothetical protein BRD56_11005 [Thermoplasmatales archaeon SW_10_69_26]|nr:MAG: hypothetical protein BRD56_11005 [Thermoplasmatales archaeon SW_10_69_26]